MLADLLAIPQHRDAIRDLIDLVQKVRNEQDGDTTRLEQAHHLEQHLDLVGVQAGCWLVEDQDFGRHIDAASDGDDLLDGNGVVRQGAGDVDVQVIGRYQGFCFGVQRARVDHAPAHGLATQIEVFSDGERRDQVDFLIDGANTQRLRFVGAVWLNRLPLQQNRASVFAVDAGDQLDEGRFACAVFTEHRMDFARVEVEVDVGEGFDATECFGQFFRLQ